MRSLVCRRGADFDNDEYFPFYFDFILTGWTFHSNNNLYVFEFLQISFFVARRLHDKEVGLSAEESLTPTISLNSSFLTPRSSRGHAGCCASKSCQQLLS